MSRSESVSPAFVIGSIVTVVIGAALLATMLFLGGPPGFAMRIGDPEDQPAGESVQPADGDTVHVVEYGVSMAKDTDGNEVASIGAVMANTSKQMTAGIELHVDLLDDAGDPVSRASVAIEVPPIPPDSELGVAAAVRIDDTDVADVALSPQTLEWWETDPARQETSFAVSDIETVDQTKTTLYLAFRVEAEAPLLKPDAAVIYRDDRGTIIGGSDSRTMDERAVIPTGSSHQELTATNVPEGTDPSQTDIYIHERLELR